MFGEGFWVALAFVVFIALVYKPVGRMIGGALDSRSTRIKDELEEAVRLREEAGALLAKFQRQQGKAAKEAEEILAHARDEAERNAAHAGEALEALLARREQQAMDRIARAEQEALAEVRTAAVDLAVRAARRLLERELDEKRRETLIDEAVKDLEKNLH